MTVGVTYDTTSEQMKTLIEDLTEALKNHPQIINQDISVAFTDLADSSLNILIIAIRMKQTMPLISRCVKK